MDRGPSDSAEVGLNDEKLVELDRLKEVALDTHARQPDTQDFEKEAVVQAGRPKQLRLGEAEEAQVRLIVNDACRVDILPADVFLDAVTGQKSSFPAPRRARAAVRFA